jgi:hypothetical protein
MTSFKRKKGSEQESVRTGDFRALRDLATIR